MMEERNNMDEKHEDFIGIFQQWDIIIIIFIIIIIIIIIIIFLFGSNTPHYFE